MTFIDTHAHLYLKEFDADRSETLRRAQDCGVAKIFLPNVDSDTTDAMLALEAAYPDVCYAMAGLHPCSVSGESVAAELAHVRSCLEARAFCAIGEIGLDLYWDKTFLEQQKYAFRQQIRWATEFDIPIVIHSRDATKECIELISEEKNERLRGIFHCFGGSVAEANAITELGFLLGIGGVLTYKKSGLDETLKHISLDCLVLETDAPYLAPVPNRGKRNESSYIPLIAQRLAEVKNVSVEEIAATTTDNALRLFGVAAL